MIFGKPLLPVLLRFEIDDLVIHLLAHYLLILPQAEKSLHFPRVCFCYNLFMESETGVIQEKPLPLDNVLVLPVSEEYAKPGQARKIFDLLLTPPRMI